MSVAEVRGVNIRYDVFGASGPWVALITGGRRGHEELVPLARLVAADGFRVLLHDRRNTGASDVLIEDVAGARGEEEIWTDDLHVLLGQLNAIPAFVGGSSSGARTSMLFYLRHPEAVRALLLMRVTGGASAAARLPGQYYGQFIKAAEQGGMAAVCATEQYQERIAANPSNRDRLMRMDTKRYIEVMSCWRDHFLAGVNLPVMGVSEAQLRSIKVPTIILPGNDHTHSSSSARAAQAAIPGCELYPLAITDQDRQLIPITEWAPDIGVVARSLIEFMRRHGA